MPCSLTFHLISSRQGVFLELCGQAASPNVLLPLPTQHWVTSLMILPGIWFTSASPLTHLAIAPAPALHFLYSYFLMVYIWNYLLKGEKHQTPDEGQNESRVSLGSQVQRLLPHITTCLEWTSLVTLKINVCMQIPGTEVSTQSPRLQPGWGSMCLSPWHQVRKGEGSLKLLMKWSSAQAELMIEIQWETLSQK